MIGPIGSCHERRPGRGFSDQR